jgi:hypothetical protein
MEYLLLDVFMALYCGQGRSVGALECRKVRFGFVEDLKNRLPEIECQVRKHSVPILPRQDFL